MDIGDDKNVAGNLIGDLFSLDQESNVSSGPCLSYVGGVPMPGLVPH